MTTFQLGTMFETQNSAGRSIRCLLEGPDSGDQDAPLVVVAPSYALSMRHFGPLSLFLTLNGFRSLRFDYTDHVGASDGDVYDYKLSTAADDLRAVMGSLAGWGVTGPVGVISVSMGARIAFRALQGRSDIATLVSLVGVVNLQDTLNCVIGEDVVAEGLSGHEPHAREVLGYHVGGQIVMDAIEHDLTHSSRRNSMCRNAVSQSPMFTPKTTSGRTWRRSSRSSVRTPTLGRARSSSCPRRPTSSSTTPSPQGPRSQWPAL